MAIGLRQGVSEFFEALDVYEDKAFGKDFKSYIFQSIQRFLENENKDTAFDVYLNFFDAYKISMGESSNQFLDLLDMMRSYEENASILTAKQRDHYVHSVNVFLLGLAIYGASSRYQDCFATSVLDRQTYPDAYQTDNEEFFYRWGIAALFHDVGYPVEIVSKQANQYLNFVVEAAHEGCADPAEFEIRAFLDYEDFSRFNRLPDAGSFESFCEAFLEKQVEVGSIESVCPIDLLAYSISKSYGLEFPVIKQRLDGFLGDMQKYAFVDHGFYSAIIVLQWYALLMQKNCWNPNYFFTPLLDCAAAILLHNYYGNVLQKAPFSLGPMEPRTQPLAYLLVLCDELQEWNREAYGYVDKKRVAADCSDIEISDGAFKVVYISDESLLGKDFEQKKKSLLEKRLDLSAVFPDGFEVESVNSKDATWRIQKTFDVVPAVARPLLTQLEALAREIHERYREDQKDRQKGERPELRDWDELPEDLKYSNLSQARHIVDKLRLIGCGVAPRDTGENTGENTGFAFIQALDDAEVEYLSIIEHDRWVDERTSSGWVYGEVKNSEKRISPYLVPWDSLTEEIKDLDRNTVRNIVSLLKKVGLGVYRVLQ